MTKNVEFSIFRSLEEWYEGPFSRFKLIPLFGDASARRYFRLFINDETFVVMQVASVAPGEFGRGDTFKDFCNMQRGLKESSLPVPEIIHTLEDDGVMILEDLGNSTLYSLIEENKNQKIFFVKMALDLLIEWQKKVWSRSRFETPGDTRSFTHKLFMDEFHHFYEYMIEKRVYHPPIGRLWGKLQREFGKIAKELKNSPYILSHRDFQSKNIMQKENKLYLIDFQDAIQAPIVYDLVSLLRDSYIVLSDEELSILLDHYWDSNPVAQESFGDKALFMRMFHLQTVQRKLKDAGRFLFLHQVKGKTWFLPFARPSLFYARESLLKLELGKVCNALAPFLPEMER